MGKRGEKGDFSFGILSKNKQENKKFSFVRPVLAKEEQFFLPKNRRGQLTVFIIAAIVIVGAAALFFALRQNIFASNIPADFQPVYNSFLSCLQDDASVGISVLNSQGGYIEIPSFEPGSSYMPFSSQLDFLGNPIPYWHYVSGNNIERERAPTIESMQVQLEKYIEGRIRNCKFDGYYAQGFGVSVGEPKAGVAINGNSVDITLNSDLAISKGNESAVVSIHKVSVSSEIGNLYSSAKKIYDYEQQSLFLENYGIDTLRLYAPVDGVELTCSPLTWNANSVIEDLKNAVEANTISLKARTSVFSANANSKYFVADISVPYNVRFLNSKNWSSSFDISPSENSVLISTPVGNQPGLGILGFCYVPYHFVYNAKYPVLVQIFGKAETFQFPLAVIIQGNKPRKALDTDAVDVQVPALCDQKNTAESVSVLDTGLNAVDAKISYECSGTVCDIGQTTSGMLTGNFPQCVNGYVIAKADGFAEKRLLYSIVESGSVSMALDRLYSKGIQLMLDGMNYNGQAIITFSQDSGNSQTVVYPSQRSVNLSEGQYQVQVQIYRNSSLNIGATTNKKCVDVPQSGIGGFFGFTDQKCYTINMPSQIVSNALAGGGNQNYYFLETKLQGTSSITIDSDSLPLPTTIDQLQQNYILFDSKTLRIDYK